MDDLDRLLAELKAKHGPSADVAAQPDAAPAPDPAPIQSLDQLLGQLEEGKKRAVRTELSKHPPKPPVPSTPRPQPESLPGWDDPAPPTKVIPLDDPILTRLKAEQEAQSRAEQLKQEQERRAAELQRQREEQEKQRRLAALQAQRRSELAKQAEQWLKALKPRSEEGLWFEEFACNYESRLEAAIEYLEALQTVEREGRQL